MVRVLAWRIPVCAALATVAMAPAFAPAQAATAEVRLVHPESGVAPSFEVATVKPNADAAGLRFQLSPAHFAASHASLYDLIKFAYGIKSDDQLVGGPAWMRTEYFEIEGKPADAEIAKFDKLDFEHKITVPRLLVQSLLQDRFQLKAHVETRDLPVYALVVAKGGIKMTPVEMSPSPPPAGTAAATGAHRRGIRQSGPNQYTASAWPINQLPEWLDFFDEIGNRPVVNETGLEGDYDFVLNGVSQRFPGPMNLNGVTAPDPPASIFAALPEQLGLKLVPKKAPVEVLVIESVEQPTEN